MKRIIALLLCFMFSFGFVSTIQERKVEAAPIVAGLYALYFGAGVGFTAFATYAGWFYANGYHIPINTLASKFANDYYDYANGVYIEKSGKVNILEKLNLATSSFLSGNDVLSISELQDIQNSIVSDFPKKVNVADLDISNYLYGPVFDFSTYLTNNGGYYELNSNILGSVIKYQFQDQSMYTDYFVFLKFVNTGWTKRDGYNSYYPNIQVIEPNGKVHTLALISNLRMQLNTVSQLIHLESGVNSQYFWQVVNMLKDKYSLPDNTSEYTTINDTFASAQRDFLKAFPNYYAKLNGKASNTDDLIGLMNTDEQLQLGILEDLQNQVVNNENDLVTPSIGADGNLWFGDLPADPTLPYTPTDTWYNNLMGWLVGMPDKIADKVADIPILGDIVGAGQTIVGKLTDIWDWITEFLWGILQSMLDAILDIVGLLTGLPAKLIDLLKNAMIWLFVPEPNFIGDKIDIFRQNFAFIDTFSAVISRFEDLNSNQAIPTVTADLSAFQGTFGGESIDMGNQAYVLDMRFYAPFKPLGDLMLTAFVWIMFLWRFFSRLPEIISGGGLLYTADENTASIRTKLEAKKKK